MKNVFHNNYLLISTVAALSVYWLAGLLIPNPFVSSAASLLLLIAGVLTLYRYFPTAYRIVVHGQRNDDKNGDGSHLAVYGIALIAAGSCYVGLYGLLWVIFGQPSNWLGTPQSGFGRAVAAVGFWLLFTSPDVRREEIPFPRQIWLIVIIGAALLASFVLGAKLGLPEANGNGLAAYRSMHFKDRPVCPEDRQVIGSGSGVYHDTGSPHRKLVVPVRCFKDDGEAENAGFRPPN